VDQITVLEHGRIVEHGAQAELMQAHGLYHAMVERQATQPDQPSWGLS